MVTYSLSRTRHVFLIAVLLFAASVSDIRAQDHSVRRELANLRADMGVLNENMRKLNAAHDVLKEENSSLRDTLATIRKRVSALADENRAQQENLQKLRAELKKERSARRELANELVETVTDEVERILERHTERTPSRRSNDAAEQAAGDIPIQGRYTVVRGDSLSAIAGAFDVSVKRLKEANNLTTDLIREGQVLNIPEPQ
ncbi:MAG: LysM peptidoglycan-binding domain-containing protein [Verrucomicrobiota bacterium]